MCKRHRYVFQLLFCCVRACRFQFPSSWARNSKVGSKSVPVSSASVLGSVLSSVMDSFVGAWPVEHRATDFLQALFPDHSNWEVRRNGQVFAFIRGNGVGWRFVTHGTPLPIAHAILRTGLRVGTGQHSSHNGWFCIDGGNAYDRIVHARDKSSSMRCLEFQLLNYPSAWTVPCVLAWEAWPDTSVTHLEQYDDGCWLSCIQEHIGARRDLPSDCALFVSARELHNYTKLWCLQMLDISHLYMLCCGIQHEQQYDPIYWSRSSNNLPPTCGRFIGIRRLRTSLWKRKKKSKVWFCPGCLANGCRPVCWL